jgi:GGDEF domain-containing protein/methanogenic corrinoid protein MtbC1
VPKPVALSATSSTPAAGDLGGCVNPVAAGPGRRGSDVGVAVWAKRLGEALTTGDGAGVEQVVVDALASGLSPEAIHSLVITPAMERIGEMWELRLLGVADEHLATSRCRHALIRLLEAMSSGRGRAGTRETVVLAAVEGQHHILGLRMVADVLEAAGYRVLYLGAEVPVPSLREFALQHQPSVVGVGILSDISSLADSLWALHEVSPTSRIMLGGRSVPPAFQQAYTYVASSMHVTSVVDGLLAEPPRSVPSIVQLLRSDGSRPSRSHEHSGDTDTLAERMSRAADQAVDLAREHFRMSLTYRELALRDPLTGLANRQAFEDALDSVGAHSDQDGAVLMIDVDRFKAVNDERGHDAGDHLLRAIGQSISDAVRPKDVPARVGGDEFAILLRYDDGDRVRDRRTGPGRCRQQCCHPSQPQRRRCQNDIGLTNCTTHRGHGALQGQGCRPQLRRGSVPGRRHLSHEEI